MQDINSGVVVGRLAADPELRSLPSGMSICQLRLAFNTSKKDSASGEWSDVGNFIDVKVWGKQGEAVARNLVKGRRIGVSYRLEVETWQAQDGGNRSKVVLVADRVQYLDPKDQDGGGGSSSGGGFSGRSQQPAQTVAEDDDIPF